MMQELTFLIHTLIALSECRAKLGSSKVGLQSRAVRQTEQIHLSNRLQGIRFVGIRHKSGDTIRFHAFWRRLMIQSVHRY